MKIINFIITSFGIIILGLFLSILLFGGSIEIGKDNSNIKYSFETKGAIKIITESLEKVINE